MPRTGHVRSNQIKRGLLYPYSNHGTWHPLSRACTAIGGAPGLKVSAHRRAASPGRPPACGTRKSEDDGRMTTPGNDPGHELTLRVAKAMPKDAGRGMARLDPADMERLGAKVGDVVAIKGQQGSTALKIMPAQTAQRGKRQIQIDGIARENAGAGLDEHVAVGLAKPELPRR